MVCERWQRGNERAVFPAKPLILSQNLRYASSQRLSDDWKRQDAATGERIKINAESICVHGDSVISLEVVKAVRQAVEEHGLRTAPVEA